MNLQQLQYIVTIAETKSISLAAKKLYISQPALSHILAKTEKELGVTLFDRSSHPLSLTLAGENYVEMAYKVFRLQRNFEKSCADIAEQKIGTLKIGIPSERAAQIMPPIIKAFKKTLPGYKLIFSAGKATKLLSDVKNGIADFCILPWMNDGDGFSSHTLFKEELFLISQNGIVQNSDLCINNPQAVELSFLEKQSMIIQPQGTGIRTALNKIFSTYKLSPNIALEFRGNNTLYTLASSGLGVAVVPKLTLELSRSIDEASVYSITENGLGWDISAIFRKDEILTHAENLFIQTVQELFSSDKNKYIKNIF